MKTRNVVALVILIIASIFLAGCETSESVVQARDIAQVPVITEPESIVPSETESPTVAEQETSDESVEVPTETVVEIDKLFFQQSTDLEIWQYPPVVGKQAVGYPVEWAFCLRPGESYYVIYMYKDGATATAFPVTPSLQAKKGEEIKVKLRVVNLSSGAIVGESEWVELSEPATGGYLYIGGISNSVSFAIDETVPPEVGIDEKTGKTIISVTVTWDVCVAPNHFVQFVIREKNNTNLRQMRRAGLIAEKLGYIAEKGKTYEVRLEIVSFISLDVVEKTEWIELPALEDLE